MSATATCHPADSTTVVNGDVRVALLGSPNAGKTTLFNALTGLRAKTGNYPGVTVERREGIHARNGRTITLVDLPGTYSLHPMQSDEQVVLDVLEGHLAGHPAIDAIMVVADACSLERSLLLVGEVMRLGKPTCLVLTMMDELQARGGWVDLERLQDFLGVDVVGVIGHRGRGIDRVDQLLEHPERWRWPVVPPPDEAHARAAWAAQALEAAERVEPGQNATTDRLDGVLLHPVAGTLVFVAVMVFFFQVIFKWAVPLMDLFDAGVGGLGEWARATLPAGLFTDFLADGIIGGVGAVVVFVPQIALLFTLLYLLEDVGYMARAAFVVDRVMARIGLEGRCFVSLLSSYACAVPGIMATRTIPSPRNRLVTILVAPLMTCSARLPVYALLIAAFVPATAAWGPLGWQGLTLLGLYLLGSVAALVVAAVLKRFVGRGEAMPVYMELPPYRWPTLRLLFIQVWGSVSAFLSRAGRIILAANIVLWVLFHVPYTQAPPGASAPEAKRYVLEHSIAGRAGKALEPAFAPLGFDWKVNVGLVASLAAREVIVSTLGQVYAATDEEGSLRDAVRADPVFTPATVAALLMFFVFALQCMSTLAIMRRETNGWRWPAFAFGYMFVLAYAAAFAAHRLVGALAA